MVKILKKFTSFFLISFSLFLFCVQNSFAVGYKGIRAIDEEKVEADGGKCTTLKTKHINKNLAEIDVDPNGLVFDTMFQNIDVEWELDNPTCIAFVTASGAAVKSATIAAKIGCKVGAAAALVSSFGLDTLTPKTAAELVQSSTACAAFLAAQDYVSASFCCSLAGTQAAVVTAAIGSLASIYATANHAYKNARICGHNWNTWRKDVSETVESSWKRGVNPDSYAQCLKHLFFPSDSDTTTNTECGINAATEINNQAYREYIYGGIEFEDEGGCTVPADWDPAKRNKILGYDGNYQRYYMRGYEIAPNFACGRFLVADPNDKTAEEAYECCRRKSQNSICIESTKNVVGPVGEVYHHKFCTVGSNCVVADVVYTPYESRSDSSYVCAKTYSVCPYNHLLGGGTEEKCFYGQDCTAKMEKEGDGVMSDEERIKVPDYKKGEVKNFCQVMYHCVKKPIEPFISRSSIDNGLISSACKDMRGDSQNEYEFNSELLPIINSYRFSAPIVQCFKETMENVFLNVAGDTKCLDATEYPNVNGICASGQYLYKKGEPLSTPSFFVKVQQNLQTLIKLGLAIAITFFGITVLLGMKAIERKEITTLVVKIGLVMYFALGTAWQDFFFKSVLNSSMLLSEITMALDPSSNLPPYKLDGCQFPKYDKNTVDGFDAPAYPKDKEYLRIWDTLDCKIARAIGFGPGVSVPNLVIMIVAGFLTGGAGLVFLLATFFFAFYLIFLVMRAVHMFLVSIITIVILIYVSPLTITASLFKRTKGIFDNWLKNILGFALQPMILFAYLGVMIFLFDKILIGDGVTFSGDGITAPKSTICNSVNKDNSIYCIFNVSGVKTCGHGTIECPGLEIIGLTIPFLENINKDKIASIMKAALVMYVFTQFLDKISELSKNLVGGDNLAKSWGNITENMKDAYGLTRGIQRRGLRGIKKHGVKAARAGGEKAKSATAYAGSGDLKRDVKDSAKTSAEIAKGIGKGIVKGFSRKGKGDGSNSEVNNNNSSGKLDSDGNKKESSLATNSANNTGSGFPKSSRSTSLPTIKEEE